MAIVSPDHPSSGRDFTERLVARVLQELATGVTSFPELAGAMGGAWPPETLAALKSLVTQGKITQTRFESLMLERTMSTADAIPGHVLRLSSSLPEPHPLNYDWRFSDSTIAAMVARIGLEKGSSIALLGVPSLYRILKESGHSVWLYDVNSGLRSGMSSEEAAGFICGNLQDAIETERTFDLAVADPPWYLEHYAAFFERMRDLLLIGGKAFVSVLPIMTRPSAAADQQAIVSLAKKMGFELDKVVEGSLAYDTPPFEAAALLGEGLILPQWRRADLYVFTRTRYVERRSDVSLEPLAIAERVLWKAFVFGGCSIAVKEYPASSQAFSFHSCSSSGSTTLQSVSRRSQARRHANLWSSKNHVLQASRTDCVIDLLSQCASGIDRVTALGETYKAYGLNEKSMAELRRLLDVFEECFR